MEDGITAALSDYKRRMDAHFALERRNARLAQSIPPAEWEPIDSYHLIAGTPLRPVYRQPVCSIWFAWRPVRASDGWVWLKRVLKTEIVATRRGPMGLRRRIVGYRPLAKKD